jgi:2-C-methyl-D-erythritol 2,4-cyclodiphosphate synthase
LAEEHRVGTAFDAHRLVTGRPLILGGIEIDSPVGLEGHSDADIVCHALIDALLGAAALGDIGLMFPGTPEWEGAHSTDLLALAWERVRAEGYELANADCVVVAQEVRIAPHATAMRERIAGILGVDVGRVSIRGTTTDHLGFAGRGEGAIAQAVVLLRRPDPEQTSRA